MRKTKILKLTILTAAVFGLGFFLSSGQTQAGEMKVKNNGVSRISHPAYEMNQYYAQGIWEDLPWNQDGTKILMFELANRTFYANNSEYKIGTWQPSSNITGRGTVWGNISELKATINTSNLGAWLTAYQNATHKIDSLNYGYDGTTQQYEQRGFAWSPRAGEENILYIIKSGGAGLVKCDVSTLPTCEVSTINANGICTNEYDTNCIVSTGISGTIYILGFSPDGSNIFVSPSTSNMFKYCYGNLPSNGYKIPLANPSGKASFLRYPCAGIDSAYLNWPNLNGTHNDSSPNKLFWSSYSGGTSITDPGCSGAGLSASVGDTCNGISDINGHFPRSQQQYFYAENSNPWNVTHAHWNVDDWLVGGALKGSWSEPDTKLKPTIINWHVVQIMFDPATKSTTHNLLLSQPGAAIWDENGNGAYSRNYHAMPSPSQRRDGNQVHFIGTDGKYSWIDYRCMKDPGGYDCQEEAGAPTLSQTTVNSWGIASSVINNWGTMGVFLADLDSVSDNPADVDGSGSVNIKDIQICIKAIVAPGSISEAYFNNCKKVAPPIETVNIKDIQVIIQKIINP